MKGDHIYMNLHEGRSYIHVLLWIMAIIGTIKYGGFNP